MMNVPPQAAEAVTKGVDPDALGELLAFLPCSTPDEWVHEAVGNIPLLLVNHAYLEKCAARSALNLMFKYPDVPGLMERMSRIAREELVHFEQVMKIMRRRQIRYRALKPSRYAGLLNDAIRKPSAEKLVDTLIVGAFIEARSCERFLALLQALEATDAELARFYASLLKSEVRHYQHYLALAKDNAREPIDSRIAVFRAIDHEAIASTDEQFRFHSGVPARHAA